LADIFDEAGIPPGVINVVPGGREAGEQLISHKGVNKVSFTGSTAVGKHIAEVCGRDLRRYTLELGGKSAGIVLEDADMAQTMVGLKRFAFANNGQTCTNQTRLLVARSRHDEFVDALCDTVNSMQVGDPMDPATDIGPLVAERQRERVEGYIRLAQEEGAKVAAGGGRPTDQQHGWFVQPTVITNANNQMRVSREEIFGPVVSVIPFDDEAEAIQIANDSDFGLSGGVYGGDDAHASEVAEQLSAGLLFVNGKGGSFDAPFGGFKQSGIGRECGREGLFSFLESKSLPLFNVDQGDVQFAI
jgi:betaine-aldehyde dehydrogenase